MRLDNKVALVTGAASGFGKGIAATFAREGARVAVIDIDGEAARAAAASISNTAIAVRCDVSRRADVDAAVKATVDAFGGIDILVNNAGMSHVRRPMLEVEEAEFDRLGYGNWVGCEYRPRARTEDGLGWARAYGLRST